MQRTRTLLTAGAAAVLALGGVVASQSGATATPSAAGAGRAVHVGMPAAAFTGGTYTPRAHALVLEASGAESTYVDANDSGSNDAGDYGLFREILYKAGTQVGEDSIRCVMTFNGQFCDGTYLFPGKGQITVAGALNQYAHRLAITGGTNDYSNVRGQLIFQNGGRSGRSCRGACGYTVILQIQR